MSSAKQKRANATQEKKVTQHDIPTLCRKIQVLDLHPAGGGLLLRGVRGVPGPEDDPAGEKRRRAAGGVLLRPADKVIHARQQVRAAYRAVSPAAYSTKGISY